MSKYTNDSDDEGYVFRSQVKTLKHVALEISDTLKTQNQSLQKLHPSFEEKLLNILMNTKLVKNIKPQHLKMWLYYIMGTLVIFFVFLVLFVLF